MTAEQLSDLARRWRAAEQQLYPAVLGDPDTYARTLRVVRAIVDDLIAITTPAGLAESYRDPDTIVAAAAHRVGVEALPVPAELLAGAAFRLRLDAVREQERRRRAADLLATARAEGRSGWITLFERGVGGSPPAPPYERLEAHLTNAPDTAPAVVTALQVWVDLDPDSNGFRYGVALLAFDPVAGAPVPDAKPLADPLEFTSCAAWETAVSALRTEAGADPAALENAPLDSAGGARSDTPFRIEEARSL